MITKKVCNQVTQYPLLLHKEHDALCIWYIVVLSSPSIYMCMYARVIKVVQCFCNGTRSSLSLARSYSVHIAIKHYIYSVLEVKYPWRISLLFITGVREGRPTKYNVIRFSLFQ